MKKVSSMKVKLTIIFMSLVTTICLGLGFIIFYDSSAMFTEYTSDSLLKYTIQSSNLISERIQKEINGLEKLTYSDILQSDTYSIKEKLEFLKTLEGELNYYEVAIIETNGNLTTTTGRTSNVYSNKEFKKTLEGNIIITDSYEHEISKGLVYTYNLPIKYNGKVNYILSASYDIATLTELISDISYMEQGEAYMINRDGVTVAHMNVDLVNSQYNIFEAVEEDEQLAQLSELHKKMVTGERSTGEYYYQGVNKYMGYGPIEGSNWVLAVTAPKDDVMYLLSDMTSNITNISFFFIVISGIIIVFITYRITKPLIQISNIIKEVATGDLTVEVDKSLLKMKDETGVLANSVNQMKTTTNEIVVKIMRTSLALNQELQDVFEQIKVLDLSLNEVSATTEELSASTEENAASSEEISAAANEIHNSSKYISEKAQSSLSVASSISTMSEQMKDSAKKSKQDAHMIYNNSKDNLVVAIEKAKAVDKIHDLSNSILEITSQTNLLALNAAIEAARAGEAGKGFSVVADEIRKLAENSSLAVNSIQEVTKEIVLAVEELSDNSEGILRFIDSDVLPNYDLQEQHGNEYSLQASYIQEMITDFSVTSEQLLASIEEITKVIQEMSSAVQEEAHGSNTIAHESNTMTVTSSKVIQLSEGARQRADELAVLVANFKTL